jgi:hypothetical protein
MADLTMDMAIRRIKPELELVIKWGLDSSTAQTVYKGQPILLDITTDTLYGRGFVDALTVAADDILLGIALEGLAVAAGDVEADAKIEILVTGIVGFKSTVFTNADVGDLVYMSEFGTLSATAADNAMLGRLVFVEDGYCYVHINGDTGAPAIQTGA